jgi:hypothetical protein
MGKGTNDHLCAFGGGGEQLVVINLTPTNHEVRQLHDYGVGARSIRPLIEPGMEVLIKLRVPKHVVEVQSGNGGYDRGERRRSNDGGGGVGMGMGMRMGGRKGSLSIKSGRRRSSTGTHAGKADISSGEMRLHVCLSACLSACMSVCLSVCLNVC